MRSVPLVLIVEDEAAIAELLTVNLRHHGFQPLWAIDGATAQAELDNQLPDLVLLDWMLPGDSGLVLAKRWRANPRTKDLPIIMLTARGAEADRVAGLDVGADDYVAKPFSVKELLARMRAVLRRRAPAMEGKALVVGKLQLDPATHRVSWGGLDIKLGPTEFKLLRHLMTYPERVHSRAQLLDRVWGDHVFLEERTVDVHVKRLREALGSPAAAMIETVRGAGYRLTRAELAPPLSADAVSPLG